MKAEGIKMLETLDKWLSRTKNTCKHREHRLEPEDDNDWQPIYTFMALLVSVVSECYSRDISVLCRSLTRVVKDKGTLVDEEVSIINGRIKGVKLSVEENMIALTILAAHVSLMDERHESKSTGGALLHFSNIRGKIVQGIIEREESEQRFVDELSHAFETIFAGGVPNEEDKGGQVKH